MDFETFDAISYLEEPRWLASRYGLERIEALLDRLGNPQNSLKFVHVAGTNGKGSTCAFTESILRAAGYKTGLFVSPYIVQFEERIQVNGVNISPDDLKQITWEVACAAEALAQESGEHATEFELMTAVSLAHFACVSCDIVVLEVGLGGRLDSTNVIPVPEVCAIARIGLDHTQLLGDTLEKVAVEKAGIIKRGSCVVCYEQEQEVMDVIQMAAAEKGCRLFTTRFSSLHCKKCEERKGAVYRPFTYEIDNRELKLSTTLLGTYQPYNASLSLEICCALRRSGWVIPDTALIEGVSAARWPGRFEVVKTQPTIVLDGGHNPQGALALVASLNDVFAGTQPIFVFGVLADKDYFSMINAIAPIGKAFYTYEPDNSRALASTTTAAEISAACERYGKQPPVFSYTNAVQALNAALENAETTDVICAFGSLYSIGELKTSLKCK